jgi:glucose/arabinose dehydrogenase
MSSCQAEELNRFREDDAGKHWGYPYCWSEFTLPVPVGLGRGSVWAWPSFLEDGTVTDDTCRSDYISPVVAMQAHAAPLGITFYQWKPPDERPAECTGSDAFPKAMDGFAFIAFHGSWNRDIPVGYKVVYVAMDENGDAVGEPVDLLSHEPPRASWEDGFRPVDVDFDKCGRLLVSSDGSRDLGYRGSKIVRVESGTMPTPTPTPEPTRTPWCGEF